MSSDNSMYLTKLYFIKKNAFSCLFVLWLVLFFVSLWFIAIVQEPIEVPNQCEQLSNRSMCHDLGYSVIKMPNFFRDKTQVEAEPRIQVFSPLIKLNCSPVLRFFLCVLYVPPCVINMMDTIPPCREVCEEARRGCEPVMRNLGYPWPEIMNCKKFPLYGKKGFCLEPKTKCPKRK